MTPAQQKLRELRDRRSKERQRMAELGRADSLTEETRAELDAIEAGTPDLERQLRAARVAVEQEDAEQRTETLVGQPDAEMRERIELRGRASLTNYLLAAARGRLVDGPEHELAAAAGVQGIPIELWDTERREERAVSPAPSTVGVNLDPIRPAVFAAAVVPRLGVEMPRVASGTYATATIGTSLTADAKAKGAAIAATAAALTVTTATPKRVSARLELRLEDIAAVGQANFEAALRQNLSLALSDELDEQGLNGNGTAPNLSGILQRLTDPTAPTKIADFDAFVEAFADGIDGLWASRMSEVAIVAGVDTYKLSAKTFRDIVSADLGAISFADYAAAHTGGWWTNARMPAAATNVQQAILHRRGRTGMRTAVCPHWGEVSIDDIYSGAASATRSFTMHVLLGDVILVQPAAYAQTAFKVAS